MTTRPASLLYMALTFHNQATGHVNDDRQSTYERTLRGLRCCCCLLFTLYVSLPFHFRLTLIFSHCLAYRGVRCALVLIMPARLRDAISGILAGGIPGFGTSTFLLGTSRSSCYCSAFCCCFKDDLLRTGHISCLVITSQRCICIFHSTS